MEKEKLIRVIIWGVIWLIVLGAGIFGLISYNNGNGYYGAINKKLESISDVFNNLNSVKIQENSGKVIEATARKDKIIVDYSASLNYKATFEFLYNEKDGIEYLTTSYNLAQNEVAKEVTVRMLDAIAVKLGEEEGAVNTIYNDPEAIKNYNLERGYIAETASDVTYVSINMNVSIIGTPPSGGNHITLEEFTSEISALNSEKYVKEKNSIKVLKTGTTVPVIIISSVEENISQDDIYKTAENIIEALFDKTTKDYFNSIYPTMGITQNVEGMNVEFVPQLTDTEKLDLGRDTAFLRITIDKQKIVY